ncbi:hypothetical protein [Bradyrhizobium sp. Cp5.3]|uniref:hypothetical protein n=1 Tax=Bradyrhizobium sp. Cp5.3 TaxID=443598 RepID=UPI000484F3B5|nr:hypothetical protein [Bradyrhizobium sp. Cp5.3]
MKQPSHLPQSIIPVAALFAALVASGAAGAEGRLDCSPSVDLETESCGSSGNIQTFARVTNKCACDVSVNIKLPDGGSAVFTGVKRNGGTQHDMIMACGPTRGQYPEYSYEFSCPEPPKAGSKPPRDLSKQLQAAASDAANADAKNRADLGALSQQHQQSVETNVARYKADIRNWCAAHAQRCDAQCSSKARGSANYMNACVNLCSSVVDACVADNLDDENKRARAEARVRAANANMKDVVDQLNRELGEQRAREEMEAALQVQAFLSALSAAGGSPSYSAPSRLTSAQRSPPPPPPPTPSYAPSGKCTPIYYGKTMIGC